MLEAAKRTVSRSSLCLGFFVSQSFLPAELSGVIRGGIVLLPHVHVMVYICTRILLLVLNNITIII